MAKEAAREPDLGVTTMQTTIPFRMPVAAPFEPRPLNAPRPPRVRGASPEHFIGTIRVSHATPRQATFNRFVLPIASLVVVGMLVGGYVAMHGERRVVVKPAPTAAPAVAAPIIAPAPIALVDVRIDSAPRGATVTLVDRGRTQPLGTTPLSAALDPSREYDLVVAYPDKPTKIEHLDANTTHKVKIDFAE